MHASSRTLILPHRVYLDFQGMTWAEAIAQTQTYIKQGYRVVHWGYISSGSATLSK